MSLHNDKSPFGDYTPEPQTAAAEVARQELLPDKVETDKYGIGKPRRIIVRGTIAADKGTQDEGR